MKTGDLLLIGGACLAGYFLWKQYAGGGFDDLWTFGGGGGGEGFLGGTDTTPSLPGSTQPGGNGSTAAGSRSLTAFNVTPSQSWTGVTYGQPGQPSVGFLARTLTEAKVSGASETTKNAAAAAYAGAPPRVVAKIKAGKFY